VRKDAVYELGDVEIKAAVVVKVLENFRHLLFA
jgi:hypothetical protein